MTLSPKKDFRKGPWAKAHAELCASQTFQTAVQTALVQMVYEEGSPVEPIIATASWHRIAGARAFINVLLNLAETPPDRKIEPNQNLAFPKR